MILLHRWIFFSPNNASPSVVRECFQDTTGKGENVRLLERVCSSYNGPGMGATVTDVGPYPITRDREPLVTLVERTSN